MTRRISDRFEMGLLCKEDNTEFPDSYPLAVKRLMSLEKRLMKIPICTSRSDSIGAASVGLLQGVVRFTEYRL